MDFARWKKSEIIMELKRIEVAAAIIIREGRLFATQRGYGEWKGWWEFPGGKLETGETPQQAVEREIMEELQTRVRVGEIISTVEYDYPKFHLTMHCILCQVIEGKLTLLEHQDARWLSASEIDSVRWLPADHDVLKLIRETILPAGQ